jgi:polyisoprenoid-binding protein YceI
VKAWQRWLIIGVVGLVILGVGGPFVYIHFIEGKAPSKLKLSSAKSTPGAQPTSNVPLDGTWNVTTGSEAGYRVDEVLFGQNNTAVGRTNSVTGNLTFTGTRVTAGSFSIDLTTVKSDQARRDAQFNGRIMSTATHPSATFALSQPIVLPSVPAPGTDITANAIGQLTLRSTTKPVTVAVTARRTANNVQVNGSIPITFADWSIPNPSIGPISTQDHGLIEFLLNFAHA